MLYVTITKFKLLLLRLKRVYHTQTLTAQNIIYTHVVTAYLSCGASFESTLAMVLMISLFREKINNSQTCVLFRVNGVSIDSARWIKKRG